ncbi:MULTISPECIES: ribosome silencing factor [Methylomonas]|uniref:Ribosomal silencing factor RsfS n=1 Tax=Methylomonas koyamae TaxID=702114 RepID=A0A177PGC4_9GAMM|nr:MULTISPECIES: ribosome silencing factor [Methylomonas]ANE56231.1 ribosome-associated protein IOJAP [Methylomonas sp. DH-1]ATG91141.1 ribosome-associated protein [Methylomonas koyamae]OAI18494.1 ribosome silencing factor RsfS [Methylomonas koyamae]OAI29345.1 ribosome silencing factor RsfS [Methylomonas koyamae]WNB77318.1 ribosome silencing factor [Methylomonas koyamae]
MQSEALVKLVETELDVRKGLNIKTIDVRGKTSITDFMVIATGTSSRHAKSLCDYVVEKVKENGLQPLGLEGDQSSDWILLDLGDVIVHVMTGQARELYQLEKLWSVSGDAARA